MILVTLRAIAPLPLPFISKHDRTPPRGGGLASLYYVRDCGRRFALIYVCISNTHPLQPRPTRPITPLQRHCQPPRLPSRQRREDSLSPPLPMLPVIRSVVDLTHILPSGLVRLCSMLDAVRSQAEDAFLRQPALFQHGESALHLSAYLAVCRWGGGVGSCLSTEVACGGRGHVDGDVRRRGRRDGGWCVHGVG